MCKTATQHWKHKTSGGHFNSTPLNNTAHYLIRQQTAIYHAANDNVHAYPAAYILELTSRALHGPNLKTGRAGRHHQRAGPPLNSPPFTYARTVLELIRYNNT